MLYTQVSDPVKVAVSPDIEYENVYETPTVHEHNSQLELLVTLNVMSLPDVVYVPAVSVQPAGAVSLKLVPSMVLTIFHHEIFVPFFVYASHVPTSSSLLLLPPHAAKSNKNKINPRFLILY